VTSGEPVATERAPSMRGFSTGPSRRLSLSDSSAASARVRPRRRTVAARAWYNPEENEGRDRAGRSGFCRQFADRRHPESNNLYGANNSHHGATPEDAFVAKVDAGGPLLWARHLGGRGNDHGNGIAVDIHGNAFVTGYTSSSDFEGSTN
jgi:hypothetical protein